MKRRYANEVEGEYFKKNIDNDLFKGYICYIKLKNITYPLIVNNGKEEICIKNNDYEWFLLYPSNGNYALTIMFDDNHNLIEWYFDIAQSIGIENDIPYEDDLYLDMIITPNGEEIVIDENELLEAAKKGIITDDDVEKAYKTLNYLEEKYVKDLSFLKKLTNYICNKFNSSNEV